MTKRAARLLKSRRSFLRAVAATGAGVAAGMNKFLVPEASAQSMSIASHIRGADDGTRVTNLNSDDIDALYQAAQEDSDVAALIARAPDQIIPSRKDVLIGLRLEHPQSQTEAIVIPYVLDDTTSKVAYVLFGSSIVAGEGMVVLRSIALVDGRVFVGNKGRTIQARDDEHTQGYFDVLFPEQKQEEEKAKELGGGSGQLRPLPPIPCLRDCNAEGAVPCGACIVAFGGYIVAAVLCALGVAGACVAIFVFYFLRTGWCAGCLVFLELCERANRRCRSRITPAGRTGPSMR